jgi:V8-like Glu-specific endopeptidase
MTPPSRLTLTLAMLVAVVSGGGAAVAAAARGAAGGSAADDAVVSATAPDAARGTDEALAAYWTPDRLRSAADASLDLEAASTPAGVSDATTSTTPEIAPRDLARPAGPTTDGDESLTVDGVEEQATSVATGKVFFRNGKDGEDYQCSGTSLNASNRSVVLTAGHCVHGGAGGAWAQNWVFIPGYVDGKAPFGMFAYQRMRTTYAWTHAGGQGSSADDVAMVTTYPNRAGQRLGDVVGGNGITVGRSVQGVGIEILGYPSNRSGGARLSACRTTALQGITSSEVKADSCGFGPGASGGPWLDRFDPGTGRGFARSVSSTKDRSGGLYGPVLGHAAEVLFQQAQSGS